MRYQAVRDENRRWLIVDTRGLPPRVIASCQGWYANPGLIVDALNSYDSALNKIIEEANVTITDMKL